MIEIVSPGNKDRSHSIRSLIDKTPAFLARGVHVLVVDVFPPTPRDPNSLHRAIWDDVREDTFVPPRDRPLTLASHVGAQEYTAYVESVAIGAPPPDMPLFLDTLTYVKTPLERSYEQTWGKAPAEFREMVLHPEQFPDAD